MTPEEEILTIHHSDLAAAYQAGTVDGDTFFFDNLVKDKGDFLQNWIKPLMHSWHKRFV